MLFACFPQPILVESNILNENLEQYETEIKKVVSKIGSKRNSSLNVESTHKVTNNIFDLATLKGLPEAIFFHATNFLHEIGYTNTDSLYFDNVWANISCKGDYLFPHVHVGSLISGVYYVKCDIRDKIKFFNTPSMLPEPVEYNQYNAQSGEHSCIPGSLIMFTADLQHGTEKQIGEEKIVISFNMNLRELKPSPNTVMIS